MIASFQIPSLEHAFNGELVLRFDFSRSVLHRVRVAHADSDLEVLGTPGMPEVDPVRIEKDHFGVVCAAPDGIWPAGAYRIEADYEGALVTLDPDLGIRWREAQDFTIDHEALGSMLRLLDAPGSARVLVHGDPQEPPRAVTAFLPAGPMSVGVGIPLPGRQRNNAIPAGTKIRVEREFAEPEKLDLAVPEFLLLPPDEAASLPAPKRAADPLDDVLTFRRRAQGAVYANMAGRRRRIAADIEAAMEFFIKMEEKTNILLRTREPLLAGTINDSQEHLFQRIVHRVIGGAAPPEPPSAQLDHLRDVFLDALGVDDSTPRVPSRVDPRTDIWFGHFAAGQLSPYTYIEPEPGNPNRSRRIRSGAPDGVNYLLFGETARLFYDRESAPPPGERGEKDAWLALLRTFTWTAEIALHNCWDGGDRTADAYLTDFIRYASGPRPTLRRRLMMDNQRTAWAARFRRNPDPRTAFDRVCEHVIADTPPLRSRTP